MSQQLAGAEPQDSGRQRSLAPGALLNSPFVSINPGATVGAQAGTDQGSTRMNIPTERQTPPIAAAIELFDTPARPGQGISLRAQLPSLLVTLSLPSWPTRY